MITDPRHVDSYYMEAAQQLETHFLDSPGRCVRCKFKGTIGDDILILPTLSTAGPFVQGVFNARCKDVMACRAREDALVEDE